MNAQSFLKRVFAEFWGFLEVCEGWKQGRATVFGNFKLGVRDVWAAEHRRPTRLVGAARSERKPYLGGPILRIPFNRVIGKPINPGEDQSGEQEGQMDDCLPQQRLGLHFVRIDKAL